MEMDKKSKYDYLLTYVIVGSSNVGKSAFLQKYIDPYVFKDMYEATIVVDFGCKNFETDEGKSVKLRIWDASGEIKYQPIITPYYKGSNAIFVFFDLSNLESFTDLKKNI